jgi:FdhD protein
MPPPVLQRAPRSIWTASGADGGGERAIPEETPVALVHDASTTAVMMATPADLEDLAYGFTLTERLVATPADILSVEIAETELGIEARTWLAPGAGAALAARRRQIAGPTGCGLCGVESLAEALRPPPAVGDQLRVAPAAIGQALTALEQAQTLGRATRAVHAAGWWTPNEGLSALREDVGRHNAVDKLAGARARKGEAGSGALVLTSRVSVELVQKAAVMGAELLVAISVPTALALRTAEACGITLVAVARADSFEVFTHPHRVLGR